MFLHFNWEEVVVVAADEAVVAFVDGDVDEEDIGADVAIIRINE